MLEGYIKLVFDPFLGNVPIRGYEMGYLGDFPN